MPATVRPGMYFQVAVNGRQPISVRCPLNGGPGARLRITLPAVAPMMAVPMVMAPRRTSTGSLTIINTGAGVPQVRRVPAGRGPVTIINTARNHTGRTVTVNNPPQPPPPVPRRRSAPAVSSPTSSSSSSSSAGGGGGGGAVAVAGAVVKLGWKGAVLAGKAAAGGVRRISKFAVSKRKEEPKQQQQQQHEGDALPTAIPCSPCKDAPAAVPVARPASPPPPPVAAASFAPSAPPMADLDVNVNSRGSFAPPVNRASKPPQRSQR